MDEAGYNVGMSMLEVLASQFHQDFVAANGEAGPFISAFIDDTSNKDDLRALKDEIEELLEFDTENDMRRYFVILGAAYWPPDESIKSAFSTANDRIADKLR